MEGLLKKLVEWISLFGLRLIAALAILVIGLYIAKFLRKFINKIMNRKKVDPTISAFIGSLTYTALVVFIVLAALAKLGVQTTSFIAVIGAAGLAIGLALQGSLSNFAAGFLMLIFKPFKVSDYIKAGGVSGTVNKISIFTTEIKTPDNKKIIIPNSQIMGGIITNYTAEKTRRIDFTFGVGYEDDIKKVSKILKEIVERHKKILKDPAPLVRVAELVDSSVNFTVKVWVKTEDYWTVYFDITEEVKLTFDKEGITIPYPQMDVHLIKE